MSKKIARSYEAPGRRGAAAVTRLSVLNAARELFVDHGYAGTSVAAIARRAQVAVDTVYASVGRKPQLIRAVVDMALAEGADPIAMQDRNYVQAVRSPPTARLKITTLADALGRALPRSAPLLLALRAAGATDPDCLEMFESISRQRAANMLLFAAELRLTGGVRSELTDEWVANLVWSMNSPDYFELLRTRGGTPDEYVTLLTEVWTRTLLAEED